MRTPAKNKSYVGYCYSPQHKGYITAAILKAHNCTCKPITDEHGNTVIKECPALQKLEHPYWTEKEHIRILRKLKKQIKGTTITERDLKDLCVKYDWDEGIVAQELTQLIKRKEA